MDEDQMTKPKLLVVGDSFMSRDSRYPGEHWSEMITEYKVINLAQIGASNFIINFNLMQGLEQQPDAVVIGFTDPFRVEVSSQDDLVNNTKVFDRLPSRWITNSWQAHITDNCQQYIKNIRYLQNDDLNGNKGALEILGMLTFLKQKQIKTLFSYGLFEGYLTQGFIPKTTLTELEKFNPIKINQNLSDYYTETDVAFHVHDQKLQKKFAEEVLQQLATL